MKLILPFPPSVNTYWRHPNKGAFAGKSLISAAGRKFQSAACTAIVEQLGVWEDDSQVKRMLVEWGPVIPEGKVEITISKYEKTAGAAA
ncbi:RusA family crossover junction endodeoxyribonuclease [Escherichia coli]|uniref:RusA family crossover junction endodeoxyribonuclease n=1 Tax=Escherichia coli TaxID=562 RepID=UPI000A1F9FB9|nr:hypothetical protein [Escherichia coli]OSP27980.1 hypothetical protein B9P94_24005 [Escherichia coli]